MESSNNYNRRLERGKCGSDRDKKWGGAKNHRSGEHTRGAISTLRPSNKAFKPSLRANTCILALGTTDSSPFTGEKDLGDTQNKIMHRLKCLRIKLSD